MSQAILSFIEVHICGNGTNNLNQLKEKIVIFYSMKLCIPKVKYK